MRIKKFNSSYGAILCNKCSIIVKEGFSDEGIDPRRITAKDWKSNKPLYCDKCKEQTMNWKIEKLLAGETIISKEPGNSMLPLIKSKQPVKIAPTTWKNVEVGDIVYAKVHGRCFTHLVKAKDPQKGCQIANNKGFVNGWTKQVYGKIVEVINE